MAWGRLRVRFGVVRKRIGVIWGVRWGEPEPATAASAASATTTVTPAVISFLWPKEKWGLKNLAPQADQYIYIYIERERERDKIT